MLENSNDFTPDWVSPPGETLADIMEEIECSQAELANRTGYSRKHVNKLIKGTAPIGEDTALKLEKVTGAPAGFWLEREAKYREALGRRQELEDLKNQVTWLRELPVVDMIKFGWINDHSSKTGLVAECLKYFGVASRSAWEKHYSGYGAAFRRSDKFETKFGPTVSWLRKGELEAHRMDCGVYNRAQFEGSLGQARDLTLTRDPREFCPKLKELCAASGVAVVFEPTPKGCPASGATRWISKDKALLMLSFRHKSDDHFWFSFFHEAAHIILHAKKTVFLELQGLDDEYETEANEFAKRILIPDKSLEKVLALGHTYQDVNDAAESLGVSPGIVVGRMQHEKVLPHNYLNACKVRYQWTTSP